MPKLIKYCSSIPMGMRVIEYGVDVADITRHYFHARKFMRRSKRRIYLQRESDNNRGSNSIRVMGKSKGWFFEVKKCIGYVPADIAHKLVITGAEYRVKARLQSIYIAGKDSSYIRFDLMGPMDVYKDYCTLDKAILPTSRHQKV